MTYVKYDQSHADDERWLEAGADAFAVHIAALVYSDRQLLDGAIGKAMAERVSLAVPPDRTAAAVEALVLHDFWSVTEGGYQINQFHEHAFPAEQVKRTRDRWRRRQGAPPTAQHRRPLAVQRPEVLSSGGFHRGIRQGLHGWRLTPIPNPTRPDQTRPEVWVWEWGRGHGLRWSYARPARAAVPTTQPHQDLLPTPSSAPRPPGGGRMTPSLAWVDCEHPGCEAGLVIDFRHIRNFDGRDCYCRDHEADA